MTAVARYSCPFYIICVLGGGPSRGLLLEQLFFVLLFGCPVFFSLVECSTVYATFDTTPFFV